MSGQYVYILGDHEESGTTNAIATIERGRLAAMVEAYCNDLNCSAAEITTLRRQYTESLVRILEQSDETLAAVERPHPLSGGWGGLTLIVAKLV